MRVLVCGSRMCGRIPDDTPDSERKKEEARAHAETVRVYQVLDAQHAKTPIRLLIHGSAPGADKLAHIWAVYWSVPVIPMPADWKQHGKAAGPIRNQRMLDEGKPDLVIAFPGGKGTADMVARAEKAGIPVQRVTA